MENQVTKTGYRGDMLLGLSGNCEICGLENFLFFATCRDDKRKKILEFERYNKTKYKGTCETCFIKGNVTDSVVWRYQLPRQKVDDILYLKLQTSLAPRKQFEETVKEQEKLDKEADEVIANSEELMNWKPKNYTSV